MFQFYFSIDSAPDKPVYKSKRHCVPIIDFVIHFYNQKMFPGRKG